MAPGSLLQRAARGLLYGSACLLLGAAGHAAAGGALPGIGVWAWLVPLFGLLCALLFGAGQRRFVITAAFLCAAQGCLHLLLHHLSTGGSLAGHAGLPGQEPSAGGIPGPLMEPPHPAGPVPHGAGPAAAGFSMMAAHALATLGALLCVAYGEQVLLRLAALLVSVVPPLAVPGLPLPPSPCRRPDSARQPLHGSLLALFCSRRGPPAVMPA